MSLIANKTMNNFNTDMFNNMDYMNYAKTGVSTVVIGLIALVIGRTLENFFIGKPDTMALAQLFLTGLIYDLVRDFYTPDPEAWVAFAACIFTTQPTLMPRLSRLINF